MRRQTIKLVRDNYPMVANDLLNPLLDLVNKARRHCAGDAEKFLIMMVVGVRTVQHPHFAGYTQEQLLSGDVPIFPSLGTNSRSIAESTGIAKETVRRKVSELIDAGWLVRSGRTLLFTAKAYQTLAPIRESIESLAVDYHAVVARLLRETANEAATKADAASP